jgi:hypothetical protein
VAREGAALLGDTPESFAHGRLHVVNSLFGEAAGDWPAVLENGRLAYEIGCRCRDADLQALGLAFQGLALTHQGRASDGTRLLDEAMAGAVAGEPRPMATGIIYCRMLCSSLDLHDFGRAAEWTDVIDRCAARPGLGGLPGDCRTHRAAVLLKRRAWLDGEREALRALEETERLELSHVGIAARELGASGSGLVTLRARRTLSGALRSTASPPSPARRFFDWGTVMRSRPRKGSRPRCTRSVMTGSRVCASSPPLSKPR